MEGGLLVSDLDFIFRVVFLQSRQSLGFILATLPKQGPILRRWSNIQDYLDASSNIILEGIFEKGQLFGQRAILSPCN